MSKRLSQRLQKLDNEIQLMVRLQEESNQEKICLCGSASSQVRKCKSNSTPSRSVTKQGKQLNSNNYCSCSYPSSREATPDQSSRNREVIIQIEKCKNGTDKTTATSSTDQTLCSCNSEQKRKALLNHNSDTVRLENDESRRRKQAEQLVGEMCREIESYRQEMKEMNDSKNVAIEMTKQVQEKYEKICKCNKEALENLAILKNKNDELCKYVQEHTEHRKSSVDVIKDDMDKVRGKIVEKFGELEHEAIESARKIAKNNNKLTRMVKERDDEIKRLLGKLEYYEKLQNTPKPTVCDTCVQLQSNLQQFTQKVKILASEKDKLLNELRNLQIRHCESQKEKNMLRLNMKEFENMLKNSDQSMEKIKAELTRKVNERIQEETEKCKEECKLARSKDMEEIMTLRQQYTELKYTYEEQRRAQLNLENVVEEHNKLQNKYDELVEEMKTLQNEDKKNSQDIDREMVNLKFIMEEKETALMKEKEELRYLLQEMTDVVKQHQKKIVEVQEINRQQELLLQSQNAALASKDEQIKLLEEENDAIKKKTIKMEKQLESLKLSLGLNKTDNLQSVIEQNKKITNTNSISNDKLQQELQEARKSLEEERDKVLMKDKFIEDHERTIEHLKSSVCDKDKNLETAIADAKSAAEEVRKVSKEVTKITRELEREKKEKQMILDDLEDMRGRKERLKIQVNELEGAMESFCKCSCTGSGSDVEEQQQLITDLENKIVAQRKEWEIHKDLMNKQKEQALNAAKFATQKLLDTVTDFQKQVDAQKKVQEMLAEMLQQKEEQLKCVTSKVSWLNCQLQEQSQTEMSLREQVQNEMETARNICNNIMQQVATRSRAENNMCCCCRCGQYPCVCRRRK